MMRTATFAAVVLFAAVLFTAAPAAAQEVYSAPCGEESVWRFYPGTPTGTAGLFQYHFTATSNPASNMLGLRVDQHDTGAVATPLSIPVHPAPFVTGSAWLRTARWVDVRVTCQGEGTVHLNVTRLTPAAVRWVSSEGTAFPPSTEPGVISGARDSEEGDGCVGPWNGYFRVPGRPRAPDGEGGQRDSVPASDSLYEIEVFSLKPPPPVVVSGGTGSSLALYIVEDGWGLISERSEEPWRRLWSRQTGDGRPPFVAVNLRTGLRYRLEVGCPREPIPGGYRIDFENALLVRVTRSEQASNLRRVQ